VGLKLRDALEEEVGVVGTAVMRGIKASLDPRAILNPGKVIRLDGEEEIKARL
jgi:FAD/FMN-containing dehydrogenase